MARPARIIITGRAEPRYPSLLFQYQFPQLFKDIPARTDEEHVDGACIIVYPVNNPEIADAIRSKAGKFYLPFQMARGGRRKRSHNPGP